MLVYTRFDQEVATQSLAVYKCDSVLFCGNIVFGKYDSNRQCINLRHHFKCPRIKLYWVYKIVIKELTSVELQESFKDIV